MSVAYELDTMFHPKSVAIVGASSNPLAWGGTSFLKRLIKLGFDGSLYPVNPNDTEIQGLKAYPDIRSLPETPDFVIIAIPAAAVPQVLED
jgi:acyl-CoA synthetase (NDP forming)